MQSKLKRYNNRRFLELLVTILGMVEDLKLFGTALVLAGGKSSRMGFDKAFINIKGKTIIETILDQLSRAFDDLIVVTSISENYRGLNARIVADVIKDAGPLGGIHAGLKASRSKYVFITACDMPFISLGYVDYMKEVASRFLPDAVISRKGKWLEPFHALYSIDIAGDIEANIAKYSQ